MSNLNEHAVEHLLYGAKPVGEYIGLSQRQVKYLVKMNRLPHFTVGNKISSTTKLLSEWLAKQAATCKSNQDS